jgi:D-glycero-D-manno-heptose 1,7-bisphosphate phosphatase
MPMRSLQRRALFLDRDGTLIVDVGYPRDPGQVRLLPHAGTALRQLQEHGFALVVVSNQSGIGRGLVSREEAVQVHARTVALLVEQGVRLDAAQYCPHAPEEGCACRKPSPEMVRSAARELLLDLSASFFVGDKASDIAAGHRAGCRTIFLVGGTEPVPERVEADFVARDWREVADWILNHGQQVE